MSFKVMLEFGFVAIKIGFFLNSHNKYCSAPHLFSKRSVNVIKLNYLALGRTFAWQFYP